MPHPNLYLDECVFLMTAQMLAARGIPLITAQAAGMRAASDEAQLRFATAHGWILLTTNARDFHRLDTAFRANEWEHAGIITIPEGSHAGRLAIRTAMMLSWIAGTPLEARNSLFRWNDLQQRLISGYTLEGYSNPEIALALGRIAELP
jgi:predicted nuclease of predicted toxin-antitoxin system